MTDIFKEYRFNEKHHLGLGDIRLTIAQQNEINDATQALLRVARAAEKFVDLIGIQLHIPVSDEEKKVKQALKEAEHLLEVDK